MRLVNIFLIFGMSVSGGRSLILIWYTAAKVSIG